MDIKKVQEIVENSQLTDEAKDLIIKMLPEAEKPEVKEEIMRVMDFEIDMNDAVADEAEEIIKKIEDGEKMVEAVDQVEDEELDELAKETDSKFGEVDEEKTQIEDELKDLSSDEGPTEPMADPDEPAEPAEPIEPTPTAPVFTPSWQQPAVSETKPIEPVPQWNQPSMPVTPISPVAPVSSVSETPAPATQPAPFPGQNGEE